MRRRQRRTRHWLIGGSQHVAVWLSFALGATAVSGQVSLQVVDASGRPVPSVRVEVYGSGELISTLSTSGIGAVEIGAERWPEVRRLSLSHIGFQTLIVQVAELPSDGVIRLTPEATEIEGLYVEGSELCPTPDEARARSIWAAAAAGYSPDTGSRARSAYFRTGGALVPQAERHLPGVSDSDLMVYGGSGGVMSDDRELIPLDSLVLKGGYAWPQVYIGGVASGGVWRYPSLHGLDAHHFASSAFGVMHDLHIAREGDEGTMIAFCPVDVEQPATIRGLLTIDANGEFERAEWLFDTPDPDAGAGGTVRFTSWSVVDGADRHLLAASGTFYRHGGTEVPHPDLPRPYSRRAVEYLAWFVHPAFGHPCKSGDGRGSSIFPQAETAPSGETASFGMEFSRCVGQYLGL